MGVLHPKREPACTGAVLCRKVRSWTFGFAVNNEVGSSLAVQHHIFRPVFGNQRKAQFFKQGLEHIGRGGCKLDEFEAHQAHGVVKQIGHCLSPEI